MLPFALRCMHALLPHRMGNPSLAIDRLCALLAMCKEKVSRAGHHAVLHHAMLHHAVLHHAVLHHAMLHHAMLQCTVCTEHLGMRPCSMPKIVYGHQHYPLHATCIGEDVKS